MNPEELRMLYESALEIWKFQIDSFWTRASTFAVLELALAAGLWKLFCEKHFFTTAVMAAAALFLTLVWIVNNSRLHEYIIYYQERMEHYERLLQIPVDNSIFLGFNKSRVPKRIPGSYHIYVQCIPVLFLLGWAWMLCWSICELQQFLIKH